LGESVPHPVGTSANARLRERIQEELRQSGYEPSVQETFVCGRDGTCARVANVLARLPGTGEGKSVLVTAHYDSVGAGPGASDDGMGVAAVLEVARILKSEPQRRNPVVFLIDDGEEAGLLGAEAFASRHPWARQVGAIINLEARGTSGASLLFETSDDNRWLVDLAAGALAHPNTSSVFYTVYKYLPNDTDLTVYREHGLAGVNFACIGDVAHYHTPLDNLENASPATLQHHGENALAMTRALAGTDLAAAHRGNAVFFDLFGAAILRWKEEMTWPAALLTLVLVLLAVGRRWRRGELRAREGVWGVFASPAMLLLPAAGAFAVIRLLRAVGALPTQWIAHPLWFVATLWLVSVLGAWTVAAKIAGRAGHRGLAAGVWVLWSAVAVALALVAPGLSFVFLIPALAAGLFDLSDRNGSGGVVAAAAASFFWLPMAWFMYDGLGVRGGMVIAAMVALPAGTFAPAFSRLAPKHRRRVLRALAAAALLCLVGASLMPRFSADSPERIPIAWHEDADTAVSRWVVSPDSGKLPPAMKNAANFGTAPIAGFPWSPTATSFAAPAAASLPDAPEFLVRDDRSEGLSRRVAATVRSPRGAPIASLAFPPSSLPDSIRVGGEAIAPLYPRAVKQMGGWRIYSCRTLPPEGVSVEIVSAAGRPIDFFLGDTTYGLPPGGERLASARRRTAVTSQSGDVSVVTRRIRLK
jgi:hypothetical protein